MSYYDDNEDSLIYSGHSTRMKLRKPYDEFIIRSYDGIGHKVNPCPKCGKSPVRLDCGGKLQFVSCLNCNIHAMNDAGIMAKRNFQTNIMSAIDNWNLGNFESKYKDLELIKHFIEDYSGFLHEVKACPKCGQSPERNNCGPEAQFISCYQCNVHSGNDGGIMASGGSQVKLMSAIHNWNKGKYEETDDE